MLNVYSTPDLRSPILLCGFSGWADAASAASGALRYLLLKRAGRHVAGFDPDAIYNYTTTRPLNLFDSGGQRRIEWPSLEMVAIEVPEATSDLLVMVGPEPDLKWREWVQALTDYAARLQVSAVVTFGAYLAQVHFTGAPVMTATSRDGRMLSELRRLGIEDSSYQGPTGINSTIIRAAFDRGIPAASIWVAAPNYLASTSNPKLAAALLGVAEKLIGQDLWRDELETAGRDMEQRVRDALRSRPDLADFLNRLRGELEQPSGEPGQTQEEIHFEEPLSEAQEIQDSEDSEELPSSGEILKALEEHLRRLKDDPGQGHGYSGDGD
jgi:hypothetical protein